MAPAQTAQTTDSIRQRILEIARQRFSHYGYGKTTMADIAGDADMSTANLYRYFTNKLDIASACAQNCIQQEHDQSHQAISEKGLCAEQKLLRLTMLMIEHAHEVIAENTHLNETIAMITTERPDIVHESLAAQQKMIAGILLEGNNADEWQVDDTNATAKTLLSGLTLFNFPLFIGLFPKSEFEQRAKNLIDLFVKGMRASSAT
ncbi:MAG: TetR/AcrR family transcriptional regulator [Gammaproteobacteria bacterium]|nr:TetR/AcrR family transcriptional regulator [Gammaproteobacteria bacterium]